MSKAKASLVLAIGVSLHGAPAAEAADEAHRVPDTPFDEREVVDSVGRTSLRSADRERHSCSTSWRSPIGAASTRPCASPRSTGTSMRSMPARTALRGSHGAIPTFGTADDSVPALSEEVAIAKLRLAGKPITVRRVPNAGHTLSDSVRTNYRDMDAEFRSALDWFWRK